MAVLAGLHIYIYICTLGYIIYIVAFIKPTAAANFPIFSRPMISTNITSVGEILEGWWRFFLPFGYVKKEDFLVILGIFHIYCIYIYYNYVTMIEDDEIKGRRRKKTRGLLSQLLAFFLCFS